MILIGLLMKLWIGSELSKEVLTEEQVKKVSTARNYINEKNL